MDRVELPLRKRWDHSLPRLGVPGRPLREPELRCALNEVHHQSRGMLDPDHLELDWIYGSEGESVG